jgi:hypothetical protein
VVLQTGLRVFMWRLWPFDRCPYCQKKLLKQGWPGIGEQYYCVDSCEFEKRKLGHG